MFGLVFVFLWWWFLVGVCLWLLLLFVCGCVVWLEVMVGLLFLLLVFCGLLFGFVGGFVSLVLCVLGGVCGFWWACFVVVLFFFEFVSFCFLLFVCVCVCVLFFAMLAFWSLGYFLMAGEYMPPSLANMAPYTSMQPAQK
ncbi:hypothetical protein RA279_27645, partial [Pseudomonas syringae pv. tagetis]|uniref:hypothetical protein n=1 Tax=Pseudomonas syringae group genomosp. 7 TaxID=251699 RepID=UPI0037700DA7